MPMAAMRCQNNPLGKLSADFRFSPNSADGRSGRPVCQPNDRLPFSHLIRSVRVRSERRTSSNAERFGCDYEGLASLLGHVQQLLQQFSESESESKGRPALFHVSSELHPTPDCVAEDEGSGKPRTIPHP
uniref:Uncharacterized protein n=1 Tax=Anopheles albimanus TaxID=7167 RepID=A0A182FVM6_ANOAL